MKPLGEILALAREVLANKPRSHVEAAQTFAAWIVEAFAEPAECEHEKRAVDPSGIDVVVCLTCGAFNLDGAGWENPGIGRAPIAGVYAALTRVQERCSELLEVARAAKRVVNDDSNEAWDALRVELTKAKLITGG